MPNSKHPKKKNIKRRPPYKLNKERWSALIASIKDGATITAACKAVGISRVAFYDLINRSKPHANQLSKTLNARVTVVEDALYTKAKKGSVEAQKFWLCNRASRRWRSMHRTEVAITEIPQIIFYDAEKDPPKR